MSDPDGEHFNREMMLSEFCIELPGRKIEPAGRGHELITRFKGLSGRVIERSGRINELS